MSLIYEPSMKIYKAHQDDSGTDSRYYPGQCPVPFMFYKVDVQTNCGLRGARFELKCGGETIARSVSDACGAVHFPSLYPGTYTLAEVSAPEGYECRARTYNVTADKCGNICVDSVPVRMFRAENRKIPEVFGEFTVVKNDVRTGERLEGAVFELASGSAAAARAITDSEGRILFTKLPPGVYTLREAQPPEGYILSEETHTAEVLQDGRVTIDGYPRNRVSVESEPIVYAVALRKIDAQTKQPLQGAVVELLQDGAAVLNATSDSQGRVLFSRVPAGTYAIREQTPPFGYLPNTSTYTATVYKSGNVTIDGIPANRFAAANTRVTRLEVEATCEQGAPLADAVFELQQDGAAAHTARTGADGLVYFENMAAGIYTLAQTALPAGYRSNTAQYTLVCSEDGSITVDGVLTTRLSVENTVQGYDVFFTKADGVTGDPLQGAEFELLSGGRVLAAATSDSAGRVYFGAFPQGLYTIREQAPPSGYLLITETFPVVIDADTSVTIGGVAPEEFELQNFRMIAFEVLTVNTGDQPLAGAVFELLQDGAAVKTETTGADGLAVLSGLSPGMYTLAGKAPPAGYRADMTQYTVTVDPYGTITIDGTQTNLLTVINVPAASDISFAIKDAETGAPLEGAVFELLSGGHVIAAATSDRAGAVLFCALQQGIYTIRGQAPPHGYQPVSETFSAVIDADENVTLGGIAAKEFSVSCTPLKYDVFFRNTEAAAGKAVAGALFHLYLGAALVGAAVSNSAGVVHFGSFTAGTYAVREETPAPGYVRTEQTFTAVVDDAGTVTIDGVPAGEFTFENTPVILLPTIDTPPDAAEVLERRPVISGTAVPGNTVTICLSDIGCTHTQADENGCYSVLPDTDLEFKAYTAAVFQSDPQGRESQRVQSAFTVLEEPPAPDSGQSEPAPASGGKEE